MARTLREIGHQPASLGGNGRGPTEPQRQLSLALGPEWVLELVVPTKIPRGEGYPTHYKIDLAHPAHMIAIEVDGPSHASFAVRERDEKKDAFLQERGWSVLRVSNAEALRLCSTLKCPDILLSLLKEP